MPDKVSKFCLISLYLAPLMSILLGFGAQSATPSPNCALIFNPMKQYVYNFDKAFAGSKRGQLNTSDLKPDLQSRDRIFVNEVMRSDFAQGEEKAKALADLGFKWSLENEKRIEKAPTWSEFYDRYMLEIKKKGISPEDGIRPGICFVTHLSFKGNESEVVVVDPHTDPLPDPKSGATILSTWQQFNIPFRSTIAALKEGKWPLMEAVHDVSHFVAFYRYPEFPRAIRKAVQLLGSDSYTPGLKRRMFWLMETMTLPDRRLRNSLLEFLSLRRAIRPDQPLEALRSSLGQQDDAFVERYASELADRFLQSQADYSGEASTSAEKFRFNSRIFGVSLSDAYDQKVHPAFALDYARFYADGTPLENIPFGNVTSEEVLALSFSTMAMTLKGLAQALAIKDDASLASQFVFQNGEREKKVDSLVHRTGDLRKPWALNPGVRRELLRLTRELTVRLEYTILRTTDDLPIEVWTQALLQADLPEDSDMGQFLRQIFKSEIVPKYYLGRGQPRSK